MKISRNSRNLISSEFKGIMRNVVLSSSFLIAVGVVLFVISTEIYRYRTVIATIGVLSMAAGAASVVLGILFTRKRKERMIEHIAGFSFGVEGTVKAAITSFPDPLVVVTLAGSVQWYNPAFSKLCGRERLFGMGISEIFPSIRISDFTEKSGGSQQFSYNGRDFILTGELSCINDENKTIQMLGLSFADISDLTELQKQFEEKKCVVCTAFIDNYDEVLRETPNSNHGSLIGDIERCISLWVERGEGFYRKYERDKFLILFEAAKFETLLNEKFGILNDVKEIDQQNKIPVTLSIGAGMTGGDLLENDRVSQVALDMALGRGGDQAVVKTEDGYIFFGAKSLGVEKTTKVKTRVVASGLCKLIDEASRVIIMGHKESDFDSFGAAVGLFRAVRSRDKSAYIAMDRAHNNVGEILPDMLIDPEYADGIISLDRALGLVDSNALLIVVDTHRPRMVEYPELLNRTENIVLIDHHRRSEEFIENAKLTYHEPYASSTCEMVTEILQYIDDTQILSVREAEALYCGIYMDTKAFTFKTGARTFEAAAYLRKIGVDPVGVHKLFRNDIAMYIQKSKVISNAKVYRDNIAIAVCDEVSKNLQLVVAQAADDLLNISGIEASFVLANAGNRVIISGRSLGAINVQVILENLGGGGHNTFAGAQLENNSLSIAELKLKNAIDAVLFE